MINPYTLRPLTGLHGDQMNGVLLYMAAEGAKIAGWYAKARLLKGIDCGRCCIHFQKTRWYIRADVCPCPVLLSSFGGWTAPSPGGHNTIRVPVALMALYLASERSRDETGSQVACQVPKGIETVVRKVKLDCCKSYAKLGVCPTSTAMDT